MSDHPESTRAGGAEFGSRIDLADSYLVETGCGGKDGKFEYSADHVAKDLPSAVDWIFERETGEGT